MPRKKSVVAAVRERLGAGIAVVSIDGSDPIVVMRIDDYSYLPVLELEDRTEWHIARNREVAEEATRRYWHEMAEHDPKELVALLGEQNIVNQWVAGTTFDDWIDEYLRFDGPEHQWASYDSTEREIEVLDVFDPQEWKEMGGFMGKGLAYRHN